MIFLKLFIHYNKWCSNVQLLQACFELKLCWLVWVVTHRGLLACSGRIANQMIKCDLSTRKCLTILTTCKHILLSPKCKAYHFLIAALWQSNFAINVASMGGIWLPKLSPWSEDHLDLRITLIWGAPWSEDQPTICKEYFFF